MFAPLELSFRCGLMVEQCHKGAMEHMMYQQKSHRSRPKLTRRQILRLLQGSSAALAIGLGSSLIDRVSAKPRPLKNPKTPAQTPGTSTNSNLPGCIVRPEQTEGPYFVDEKLLRSDIRSDPSNGVVKPGVPLQLTFVVSQVAVNSCVPIVGAWVDIWHCDALGNYSDVQDTVGQKFLRGYQITDTNGIAAFTTIYPGWYPGRTVHIHFKIRLANATGQTYEFTSQLYFDDATSNLVYAQAPYVSNGQRDIKNNADGIFRNGGDQLLLSLTPTQEGYSTVFTIGLDGCD
jgi:protocatechuate 3,4-dioxygenase beta subunit